MTPMEFCNSFMLLFWAFFTIFMYCEFGEMVTGQFELLNDELKNCDWYNFPIQFQQMFVIVLANAHLPVTIHGFGKILCIRDVMKKVFFRNYNRAYSDHFFMYG